MVICTMLSVVCAITNGVKARRGLCNTQCTGAGSIPRKACFDAGVAGWRILFRALHTQGTQTIMERAIDKIIRQAMERGEFNDLKGKGKPLTHLEEYFNAPEELRMGFTIMRNAGCVPEEVSLLKEVDVLKGRLANCTDPLEKAGLQRQLNDRQLKLNLKLDAGRPQSKPRR